MSSKRVSPIYALHNLDFIDQLIHCPELAKLLLGEHTEAVVETLRPWDEAYEAVGDDMDFLQNDTDRYTYPGMPEDIKKHHPEQCTGVAIAESVEQELLLTERLLYEALTGGHGEGDTVHVEALRQFCSVHIPTSTEWLKRVKEVKLDK
jgi:hypothetical protein